jgi:hypothetical protein
MASTVTTCSGSPWPTTSPLDDYEVVEEGRGFRERSAVVLMRIIAIFRDLEPQAFETHIAPVTGNAGTVVGYWFGSSDGQATRK